MTKARYPTKAVPDRAYLVSLDLYKARKNNASESLRELHELARTAAVSYTHLTLPTNREV